MDDCQDETSQQITGDNGDTSNLYEAEVMTEPYPDQTSHDGENTADAPDNEDPKAEESPRTESNSEQAGNEPEVVDQVDSSTAQEPEVLKESNQCDTQQEAPKSVESPRTESNSEQAGNEPEVVDQVVSSTAQEPEVLKESNQCDTQQETPDSKANQQTVEVDDSNVHDNIEDPCTSENKNVEDSSETVQQTRGEYCEILDDTVDGNIGSEKIRSSLYFPLPPLPPIPPKQDASQLSPTSNDDNNDIDEKSPRTESNSEQAGNEPEVLNQVDSSTAQEPEVLKESNQCDTQQEAPKSTTGTVTQTPLSGYKWYFGAVDRQNCERILKKMISETGSYMVRDCKNGGPQSPYSLSVVYNKFIYHMLIRIRPDQKYAVGLEKTGETVFDSIPDLITFHQNNFLELIGDAEMKIASGNVQLKKCPPPEK